MSLFSIRLDDNNLLYYLLPFWPNVVVLCEHKSDLGKNEIDSLVELVTVFLFLFLRMQIWLKANRAPIASGIFHVYFKILRELRTEV